MDTSNHDAFAAALDKAVCSSGGPGGPLRDTPDVDDALWLAIENGGVGIWEHDLVSESLWLSRQARAIFGLPVDHSGILSKEEWVGLIDERDVEAACLLASSPDSWASARLHEFRIRCATDEIRWLRISGHKTAQGEDRITRVADLVFDDSDRKRAEAELQESEERIRLVQDAALIGTFVAALGGEVIGSPQFFRNLGLPEDTGRIDRNAQMSLIHPDDRLRVERESVEASRSTVERIDTEYRIFRADTGEMRWIFSRIRFERTADGQPVRMLGAHLDVTQPKLAKEALDDSVAFNHSFLEASADCVKLVDRDGRLSYINKQGLAALEIDDRSTILGSPWARLFPRTERHKVEVALQEARNGQVGRFNALCPTAGGKRKWWDVIVTPLRDARGRTRQLLAISRDITQHLENLAQIRWTASHDMLTGLPNRRYFQERLEKVLDRAGKHGLKVGLLQLDLDDFKQINDALGHDAGDALLKDFTRRLQKATGRNETVVRLGGDEFAIIAPKLSEVRSMSDLVEDIRRQLARPFVYQGRVFDCRASIGEAIYPEHGKTVEDLLKSADIALYVAKSVGCGSVRRFDPSMRCKLQERADMLDEARAALREDRVFAFYQPKIRFGTGAIEGFEALLRWRGRDGRIQLPGAIFAAFEDLDIANSISERIQLRVLADVRRWLDAGLDFGHVAINASAAEFRQDEFAERLLTRMKAAGVPPSLIELEVTETVFLGRGAEYVERALTRLSAEGVRIALDDFGTGYASLSHLKQFPVDIIKIDQSFVRNLEIDPEDSAIIEALVGLGRSLSIRIVAEGIENDAQADFLAQLGCDYGQGFLFGKAVAAAEVPDLLARWRRQRQSGT